MPQLPLLNSQISPSRCQFVLYHHQRIVQKGTPPHSCQLMLKWCLRNMKAKVIGPSPVVKPIMILARIRVCVIHFDKKNHNGIQNSVADQAWSLLTYTGSTIIAAPYLPHVSTCTGESRKGDDYHTSCKRWPVSDKDQQGSNPPPVPVKELVQLK